MGGGKRVLVRLFPAPASAMWVFLRSRPRCGFSYARVVSVVKREIFSEGFSCARVRDVSAVFPAPE